MALDTTISLTDLNETLAYLQVAGITPEVNALWVHCPATGATAATVEVTATTMVLIITGGASAGTTTLTFASTDADTMTELVAKINAASGWKAGLLYHPSADSTDLTVTGALSCLTAANEITLKAAANYSINEMINQASRTLERYTDRKLKSRDYTREIYYGSGWREMLLEQYPVTRVARVSEGRADAFQIRNTSTDANFATVEVTSTTIRLIVDGGDNADDTALTLADYATIDLLITAIEALSVGWSCTTIATDTDTRDADECLIRPSMYVDPTTYTDIETPDTDLTDYRLLAPGVDRNNGTLRRPSSWQESTEYFVDYTAGFVTIPYDLEEMCLELIKNRWMQMKVDPSMKSEKMGDYSYTKFSLADIRSLPADMKDRADYYVRRSL